MCSAKTFQISHLVSGGLITNYYCTSRCRHCLYACNPNWPKDYIRQEILDENLKVIKAHGCDAIHIGGGEPMLDPDGLQRVLQTARDSGVRVEYVETNSSWYTDAGRADALLSGLKSKGLYRLLISISPFHNEYIPFAKVKGVMQACERTGIEIFPWISSFYSEVDSFDPHTPHSLDEYQKKFGADYHLKIPSRYWIHFGGRAVATFAGIFPLRPVADILAAASTGCRELTDVSHFHFDLFGNYIPGLCSGLAIRNVDVGAAINADAYPLMNILYRSGIRGLFDLAVERYDYRPASAYLSKCHLCLDIRRHLVKTENAYADELRPREFYQHI